MSFEYFTLSEADRAKLTPLSQSNPNIELALMQGYLTREDAQALSIEEIRSLDLPEAQKNALIEAHRGYLAGKTAVQASTAVAVTSAATAIQTQRLQESVATSSDQAVSSAPVSTAVDAQKAVDEQREEIETWSIVNPLIAAKLLSFGYIPVDTVVYGTAWDPKKQKVRWMLSRPVHFAAKGILHAGAWQNRTGQNIMDKYSGPKLEAMEQKRKTNIEKAANALSLQLDQNAKQLASVTSAQDAKTEGTKLIQAWRSGGATPELLANVERYLASVSRMISYDVKASEHLHGRSSLNQTAEDVRGASKTGLDRDLTAAKGVYDTLDERTRLAGALDDFLRAQKAQYPFTDTDIDASLKSTGVATKYKKLKIGDPIFDIKTAAQKAAEQRIDANFRNNNIKPLLLDTFWTGSAPTDPNLKILYDAYHQAPIDPNKQELIKKIAHYEFIQANGGFVAAFKQKFPPADVAKLDAAKAESERMKNNLSLLDQADKSLKQNVLERWRTNGIPRDSAVVLFDQITHQPSSEMRTLIRDLERAATDANASARAEKAIMDYLDKEKDKIQVAVDELARIKSAETAKKSAIDALVTEINKPETKGALLTQKHQELRAAVAEYNKFVDSSNKTLAQHGQVLGRLSAKDLIAASSAANKGTIAQFADKVNNHSGLNRAAATAGTAMLGVGVFELGKMWFTAQDGSKQREDAEAYAQDMAISLGLMAVPVFGNLGAAVYDGYQAAKMSITGKDVAGNAATNADVALRAGMAGVSLVPVLGQGAKLAGAAKGSNTLLKAGDALVTGGSLATKGMLIGMPVVWAIDKIGVNIIESKTPPPKTVS